jgi:hypothetical protein
LSVRSTHRPTTEDPREDQSLDPADCKSEYSDVLSKSRLLVFVRLAVREEASYCVTGLLAAAHGCVEPGRRRDPEAVSLKGLHDGTASELMASCLTRERDDWPVCIVDRRVPDGKRPPLLSAVCVVSVSAPCPVYGEHRQGGARDERGEIAEVVADLDEGTPVCLHAMAQIPSVDG